MVCGIHYQFPLCLNQENATSCKGDTTARNHCFLTWRKVLFTKHMHCLQSTSTFFKDVEQIFLQVSILYIGCVFPDIQRKVSNYPAHQVCLWCSLHPPAPGSNLVSQVKWAGAAAQHSAREKHRGRADQLQRKTLRPDRAKALTEKQATFHPFPLFTRYLPEVTGDMQDLLVLFLRNLQKVE